MIAKNKEELANVLTHGAGIILAIIGSMAMISMGVQKWQVHHIIAMSLFCASLLMVFTTSTIYHCLSGTLKSHFKKIDHISIYLLIGGSHTPFVIRYLNTEYGRNYLIVLWSLIIFGILYKIFLIGKWKWVSLAFYLFLGWMAVFIIPSMKAQMPDEVFNWILIGGLSYTFGAAFYAWDKLPYNHAIWHIFVIGGSFGHWLAMMYAYQS